MAENQAGEVAAGAGATQGAIAGLAGGPIGALIGGIAGGVGGASKGGLFNCLFGCPKTVVPPKPWYERPETIAIAVGGLLILGLGVYVYRKRH